MEPPRGILSSLWQFILFIPYFTGLLLLGVLKGINFHSILIEFVVVGFYCFSVIQFTISNFESF